MRDRTSSRNARAMERLQRRKRKARRHESLPVVEKPPTSRRPAAMLSDTLVLTFPHRQKSRWYTVPIAMALHVSVVLALILVPLLVPLRSADPQLVYLFINPAPPPPPPLRIGSPLVVQRPTDVVPKPTPDSQEEQEGTDQTLNPNRLTFPTEIPEEILQPKVELEYGSEDGFEFGHPLGMEGGVPGGVVGGVPGGILGGVIGGTGTGVPRNLQQPDVGPRPIRMPRPTYTVEAIRKKLSGEVMLKALIDERGKVKVLEVIRSIPELDQEAIRVVESEWLFRPAMKNGRPVASVAELVVTFNLY